MLGLYIHVPFCSAICNYCNFNRGLYDAGLKARYVEALVKEVRGLTPTSKSGSDPAPASFGLTPTSKSGSDPAPASFRRIPDPASSGLAPAADTIYFGGGTP